MLMLNLKKVLRLRGVEKHYNFLVELGFVPATARVLLQGGSSVIKYESLERLCVALNCTPNDLFEWTPETAHNVAATHSLNSMKKTDEPDVSELLGEIPLEKFGQIREILQNLKENQ